MKDWTSYQTPSEEPSDNHLVATLYRRIVFLMTLQVFLCLVMTPLLGPTMAAQSVVYALMSSFARLLNRRSGPRVALASAYGAAACLAMAGMAVSGGIYSWFVLILVMMTATLGFVTQVRTALIALGGLLLLLAVMGALQEHGMWFRRIFTPGPGVMAVHVIVGTITFTVAILTTIQAYRETLARLESKVGELHAAEAETRRLLDEQSRFFWEVSHELRSPLTRLNLSLGKVRRESSPQSEPSLARMENEVERLQKLIHQLLLLAQLKHGVEFPMNQQFDLCAEVASVCGDAEFEANVAGRDLMLESSEPFLTQGCPVEGCAELLRGALDNVVRNAIRFAPEGTGVEVNVSQPRTGLAQISVADRGPGVPESQIAMLFDPFFRVAPNGHQPMTRTGSGLGLAIAFEAVKKHGGRIAAANRPGGGLLVTMDIPTRSDASSSSGRIEVHASANE